MAIVWHDTKSAAEYLGVAPQTLCTWRVYGGGPVFTKMNGLLVRYAEADLDAWVEARRCRSPGAATA